MTNDDEAFARPILQFGPSARTFGPCHQWSCNDAGLPLRIWFTGFSVSRLARRGIPSHSDLRRTASTGMAEAGVPRDHIAKALNHVEGGPAATRIYDRCACTTGRSETRWNAGRVV